MSEPDKKQESEGWSAFVSECKRDAARIHVRVRINGQWRDRPLSHLDEVEQMQFIDEWWEARKAGWVGPYRIKEPGGPS